MKEGFKISWEVAMVAALTDNTWDQKFWIFHFAADGSIIGWKGRTHMHGKEIFSRVTEEQYNSSNAIILTNAV